MSIHISFYISDYNKKKQILSAMKFLKVRPLSHLIWGIMPTDLHLLMSVVSVCVTYTIVMVQFTHRYD